MSLNTTKILTHQCIKTNIQGGGGFSSLNLKARFTISHRDIGQDNEIEEKMRQRE